MLTNTQEYGDMHTFGIVLWRNTSREAVLR